MALELSAHVSVIGREQSADVLWIEPLRLRGEADEIDEDDRDDLAFFAERTIFSFERASARVAETRSFRVLLTTTRANHHRQSVRRARSAGHVRLSARTGRPTSGRSARSHS